MVKITDNTTTKFAEFNKLVETTREDELEIHVKFELFFPATKIWIGRLEASDNYGKFDGKRVQFRFSHTSERIGWEVCQI